MQSGLNANQYTSQVRILDVDDNRDGNQKTNDAALSTTPWGTLQPYSLVCVGGQEEYMMASKGINPNDRPMKGCVIDFLMDRPTQTPKPYTAFERGVNAGLDFDPGTPANIQLKATIPAAGLATGLGNLTVDEMKTTGLFMPGADLQALKNKMSPKGPDIDANKDMTKEFLETRGKIGQLLGKNGATREDLAHWFNLFIPDSTVISTTLGDGDQLLNELDQASGFGTFGTKVEGHAFVSQCTTQLKCRTMDTVYIVLRAKVESDSGDAKFTSPEMCFLTSAQLQKAYREAKTLDRLGEALRVIMDKTDRTDKENYVVLGGWKLGKVVDIHAIPMTDRNAGFVRGKSIYEILLNIERCTAYELVRHLM